jgi:thioesterase superfamily protein 4
MAGTGHGAMVALMLDEVMGTLAAEVFGRYNIVTARLDVGFKRRLDTPRVVLARAFVEGAKGGVGVGKGARKVEILGKVEDGEGGVFADSRSVFVRLIPKL